MLDTILAFGARGESQRHAVLQTGSASATTSSIEGASRPSSSALARTASISAWLARGPGPQAMKRSVSSSAPGPGAPSGPA